MDEKSIIKAAWSSDEQQFKQAYIKSLGLDLETGEKSYNGFQNIMRKLKVTREQNISISESKKENEQLLSELKQVLDGKTREDFKETKRIKSNDKDIEDDER